ncbi:capsular biosynthesis protein [Ideonella sp.]|uniref:capsular biosynthesis protein n=1 Tax=Ideonella sp. TaxID=1929293 RepID=UPI003BB7EF30
MNALKYLTPRRLLIILLVLPALLSTLYYGVLAQSRYASTTVLSVSDTSDSGGSALSAATALLGGSSPISHMDSLFLESYIHSMDMLLKLDAKFDLRAHYSEPQVDRLYRLGRGASREEFLAFYRARTKLTRDDFSGLLTLEVQAFEPVYAQKLARAMLDESEKFINENAHRIAREKMAFAETELARAAARLQTAKSALTGFQTRYKVMDPLSQANASSALAANLQSTQAQQESALNAALSYLSEDSLQVRTLRGQLDATKAQLEAERVRATAETKGNQLPALTVEYQGLLASATFAEEAYKGALIAVERSRMDAVRKLKTVVVMEPPTLPDMAQYPRRLIDWLTSLAVFAMFFAIVRLVHATIREHQD